MKLGMRNCVLALAALAASLLVVAPASAQALLDGYVARLGPQDHFNSNGVRLDNAPAVIRQDRANFHRFGRADPEDEADGFFHLPENRAKMEAMLRAGSITPSASRRIVNGTPLIEVLIFPDAVAVRVLD